MAKTTKRSRRFDEGKRIEERRRSSRRTDGWLNAATGYGDANRDKRESMEFFVELWDQDAAEELWRADGLFARVVEKPAREMTRRGWTFTVADDGEAAENMRARQEELQIRQAIRRCLEWRRAFGGAALFLGVKDGRNVSKPLNEEGIASFDFVTELTPKELVPVKWYGDPLEPKYGQPEVYELRRLTQRARSTVNAEAIRVHESRLVIFQGFQTTKRAKTAHAGWGDSIFSRIFARLRDFIMANESAATLVGDFSQAVYKIKGLAEMIAKNEDDAVRNRAVLVDFMRSTARAILIDSEEDFERKSTSVEGLPDLIHTLAQVVAAVCDMPLTVLLGQSPAGMNATGESDIRNWYDYLSSEQDDAIRSGLERVTRLLFLTANGPTSGTEPETWTLSFKPLWEMTDTERAEIRVKMAQADAANVNAGILLPEEAARSRFGGDEFSIETQLDDELREQHDAEEEKRLQLEEEAAASALEEARAGVPRAPGLPGTAPKKPVPGTIPADPPPKKE